MKVLRVTADTQIATGICYIKQVILDHSSATSAIIYNEDGSSKTAAAKVLTIHNSETELTAQITFPGKRGIRLSDGCYIDYNAGEVYLVMG